MTRALATAAILALSASGAFAACAGHDSAKADKTATVASIDMSTTASTAVPASDAEVQAEQPAEPVKAK